MKIRLYRTRQADSRAYVGHAAYVERDPKTHPDSPRKNFVSLIRPGDLPMSHPGCLALVDAIIPPSHWDREQGWDRYLDYEAWNKIAEKIEVELFRLLDPEIGPAIPDDLEKLPLFIGVPDRVQSRVFTIEKTREELLCLAGQPDLLPARMDANRAFPGAA